jgi:disulfide bond formation protein DsbB
VDIDAERIGLGCILVSVSTDSAQLFFSLLMFAAALGCLALVALRIAASSGNRGATELGRAISDAGVWLAFVVAATATLGSLYFSDVANFVPCRLCWFQRVAMYPLSVILLVGAIRREVAVRWYAGPLALIGLVVASYHTLIEWRPELDSGACEAFGPSCTDVWFREFGFVSLATMSLVGFLTILLLLFVRFPATLEAETADASHRDAAARTTDPSSLEHIS